MNEQRRRQIRSSLSLKETGELVEIWTKHDLNEWTEAAFDAIREILQDRQVELPSQEEKEPAPPPDAVAEEQVHLTPRQFARKWVEIWRMVFVHPTIESFSRIAAEPEASTRWGLAWVAVAALLFWFLGPQRLMVWGLIASTFGEKAASSFMVVATVIIPLLSVIYLLAQAAATHGLARLLNGAGTFRQLVYCWGVMQLPFILVIGLAFNLPYYGYSLFRLLTGSGFDYPAVSIISLISLLLSLAGLLYLFYAQLVAFSAVERFDVAKGFGVLLLAALVLAFAGACLSNGLQAMLMNALRY